MHTAVLKGMPVRSYTELVANMHNWHTGRGSRKINGEIGQAHAEWFSMYN